VSGESLPRSNAEVREVNKTFWEIVAKNFNQPRNDTDADAEFNGIIEANYGPYVAEPLVLDDVGVFFPYDWEPERLARYQELFSDFNPVPVFVYPSFDGFVAAIRPEPDEEVGVFNFLSALAAREDTVLDLALESKPAYRRAKLLAPELGMDISELRRNLRQYSVGTDNIPEGLLRGAYELLNLAGKLVDYKDKHLLKCIDITTESATCKLDHKCLLR